MTSCRCSRSRGSTNRCMPRRVKALLAAGRRTVSLVDWVSFLVMRRHGVRRAFTFDQDFAVEGFEVLPTP